MADIKKIKVPGVTDAYNVVDATAIHPEDVATSNKAGVVKIGTGITVAADGTISVNATAPVTSVNGKTGSVSLTASDVGAVPTTRTINSKALGSDVTLSASDVGAVPTTRTVNGKALSSNITLSASDVSARPTTWTPSKSDVGLGNVDNVKQYSASNPPPYPVTSVNGKTGAITLDSGGTSIVVSRTQPTGQKAGDFWFQIVD